MSRPYTRIDSKATYRVKMTTYPGGRKRTMLVPANSEAETEAFMRKRFPASGGYSFATKRVADHWRERD